MRTTMRFMAVALALGFGLGAARGQEISVRAELPRPRVQEGETVRLAIIITAPSSVNVTPPDISPIKDFEIASGPSVSSSFQWINGRTSSARTYSYALRPLRTGSLKIPALSVLVQGRTYRTQALNVTVTKADPSAPPTSRRPGTRPPERGRAQPGAPPPAVRVRAVVDRREAYVGEQITLRFLLSTQTEVLNLAIKDNPTFPGFWVEEISLPENLDLRRVEIDGQAFNEFTLMKKGLFPTTVGKLTIPSVTYQIQVRRRSRDPLESFFFTPTETLTRSSDPVTIDVRPLPTASKPPGFSGAVGDFKLAVEADREESQINDAIGVKVKIWGEGSLRAVSAPPLADMTDFKKLDPKVSVTTVVEKDRFRSEKVWEYVMIPLAPGNQVIPPASFSFFDPKSEEYRTVSSGPVPIQVARGEGGLGASLPVVAQSDVRRLRRDIHYIKLAPDGLTDRSRLFHRTPLFAALVLLPLLVDLGVLTVVRRRASSPESTRLRRERRARSVAAKRFKEARRRMTPARSRAFYAAVAQSLSDYVGDKFGTAGAGLTHQRIEELLLGRGVPEDLRTSFHRCLEACDYARFAPTAANEEEMRKTLATAEQTLSGLERALGS